MEVPDRIDRLSARRGADWTPAEARLVKEWLAEREQMQSVWFYAARYLGKGATTQDVEDAVSDFYGIVDQTRSAYKPGGPSFVNFLIHVCFRNDCVREGNRIRKRLSHEAPFEYDLDDQILTLQFKDESLEGDPSRLAQSSVFTQDLNDFLQSKRLSESQKRVFALRYLEGMSYESIAEAVGSPIGSIKGWLNRATVTARLYLEERGWSDVTMGTK